MKWLSCVRLFVTPWIVAYQAPPSMGFSRQEYWNGLPFSFSRGSSQPRDQTQVSRIPDRRFNLWATREAPYAQKWDTKKLFGDAVWLDQYCHLTACRNIRCWATLSLEEHTPLPLVILCEYFLQGNQIFPLTSSDLLWLDGVKELGLSNEPGAIDGEGSLMGAHPSMSQSRRLWSISAEKELCSTLIRDRLSHIGVGQRYNRSFEKLLNHLPIHSPTRGPMCPLHCHPVFNSICFHGSSKWICCWSVFLSTGTWVLATSSQLSQLPSFKTLFNSQMLSYLSPNSYLSSNSLCPMDFCSLFLHCNFGWGEGREGTAQNMYVFSLPCLTASVCIYIYVCVCVCIYIYIYI